MINATFPSTKCFRPYPVDSALSSTRSLRDGAWPRPRTRSRRRMALTFCSRRKIRLEITRRPTSCQYSTGWRCVSEISLLWDLRLKIGTRSNRWCSNKWWMFSSRTSRRTSHRLAYRTNHRYPSLNKFVSHLHSNRIILSLSLEYRL